MSWDIKKLNECCISIADGDHLPPPKSETGIPFVTIANIDSYNHFDFTDTMFVPQSYYDKLDSKRKARKGDILLTVVGSFGIPILITDDTPFVFQRHIAILRPDPKVIDSRFLYYTMLSKSFYAQADAYAIGAAQRTISLTSLRQMKVAVPDLDTQGKIADALSLFDNIIDNNNKQMKSLEQMAENLYKEWFVRFRFPGYKTAKFEDGIPVGWEYVKLRDILSFERGISYSSEEIDCDEGLNLINLKNIEAFGGFRRDGTKTYNGKYKERQMVKTGDLVIGVTDMTQDRRTVGAAALIPTIEGLSVISADLVKVVSDIPNIYLYSLCRYGFYSKYFSQFSNGANVLHLKPGALLNKKLLLPTKDLVDTFVEKASTIIELIDQLNLANDNLTKQRDLLLPRLMSGKLEV